MPDDFIPMYDENGKPVKVPRKQWAEEILPDTIRQAWDDPQMLYAVLVAAINEKMGPSLKDAIAHLKEIDSDPQRPTVLEAVALMQENRLDEAEQLLQSYMDSHVPTGSVLTNLARIYWDRNQKAQAEATLRRALSLDANLEGTLGWYLQLQQQRGGQPAAQAALEQLAREAKNWRARMWMAAGHLRAKRVDDAITLYRQVLSHGQLPPDAMLQITSDLGGAGRLREMVEMVLPAYSLSVHGPYAGINLVQALITLRMNDQAATLMNEMEEMKHPALSAILADLKTRMQAAASSAAAPAPKPAQDASQVAAVPLLNPVWTAAFRRPDWLLPALKPDAVKIAFFSLADMSQPKPAEIGARQALAAALPMYWAEAIRLRGSAATACVVPARPKLGLAAVGQPWPLPHMLAACPPEFKPDYAVCGALKTGSRGARIELHIFRVSDRQAIGTLRVPAAEDFTGAAQAAEKQLLDSLANAGVLNEPPSLTPPKSLDEYVLALANLLIQTMAAGGLIDLKQTPNERPILEAALRLATEDAESPLPTIVAAASILTAEVRVPTSADAFKKPLADLWRRRAGQHDCIRRLTPAVHKMLDEVGLTVDEIAALRQSEEYAKWADRLTEPPSSADEIPPSTGV